MKLRLGKALVSLTFCRLAVVVVATGLVNCEVSLAQSPAPQKFTVGWIDFFGTGNADLQALRAKLPVDPGDTFTEEQVDPAIASMRSALTRIDGHPPTDVGFVCCDAKSRWMFYVGLGDAAVGHLIYNTTPTGHDALPKEVVSLYRRSGEALKAAVEAGNASEDDAHGYALPTDPTVREIALQMRQYAIEHGAEIRRVAKRSASVEQRQAAVELLGYCLRTKDQIAALDDATRDADSEVRNNATRALYVLASASPAVAASIPVGGFVAMLNSGIWTDRNKASLLLLKITQARSPRVLEELRCNALASLVEMAQWRLLGHAMPSLFMLGRIEGLSDGEIDRLINGGQKNVILSNADLLNGTCR